MVRINKRIPYISDSIAALMLVTICTTTPGISADGLQLPKIVYEALVQNAEQLSPITVSFTTQYKTSMSPDAAYATLQIMNPPPEIFFAKEFRRDIWQDGKMYSWTKEVIGEKSELSEISYNGRILYVGQPDQKLSDGTLRPVLSKQLVSRLADRNPGAKYMNAEYYEGIGLLIPTRVADMLTSKGSHSQVLSLLESGGRLSAVEDVELNGKTVTRVTLISENLQRRRAEQKDMGKLEKLLRSGKNSEEYIQKELSAIEKMRELPETKVHSFYLDQDKNYAVLRKEDRYEDGTLLLRVNNSEFEQLPGRELWLPRKSTTDYFTFSSIVGTHFKNPVLSRVREVSGFGVDSVPDNQFVLDYRAVGSIIVDDTGPFRKFQYQIPADTIELDLALESIKDYPDLANAHTVNASSNSKAFEKQEPTIEESEASLASKETGWPFVIVLNAIAFFVCGIIGVWRYQHRKNPKGKMVQH